MTNLEVRFQRFMLQLPSVEGIDGIDLSVEERKNRIADYFGLGRSVIFEQKCINQDQSDKIQSEVELHSKEDYYPHFYGERDIDLILEKFPDAENVKRRIYSKITKLLEDYLSSANKQIKSTSRLFNLTSHSGVLIILNDKVKVLSPEIISSRVAQRLKEKDSKGILRFNEIAYVLLISETHLYKGQVPTALQIEAPGAVNCSKKVSEYLDYIVYSWALFNGGSLDRLEGTNNFFNNLEEKPEPAPTRVTRSEERRIWYQKKRYMKNWSDDTVLEASAKLIENIKPFVMKDGPKMPMNELADMILAFGDFIEESNYRGLDLKDLKKWFSNIEH
jgi:hypothetical protein